MSEGPVIDASVLSEISLFQCPLKVSLFARSAWARGYRIDIGSDNDRDETYFLKVSIGEHGRAALEGEFESTSAMHAVVPDFTPKPIAWGSFKSIPDTHYYLCKFHVFSEKSIPPEDFCTKLVKLHKNSESPNGKFGFHVVTYNGNIPQDNSYSDTWEEFFLKGFEHSVHMVIERGGPWEEMEKFKPVMISKIIPRLLRPLETEGRSIKPALVHGDLWCGNAAVIDGEDRALVFDPASFYAHNEYELGNWRHKRNLFAEEYSNLYFQKIDASEPRDEYDDRNRLYGIRFNMHAAALFPETQEYRVMVIDDVEYLVAKYAPGYERAETHAAKN